MHKVIEFLFHSLHFIVFSIYLCLSREVKIYLTIPLTPARPRTDWILVDTQLSFISPRLTITSIFIDQSLEYFLSIILISSEIDFLLSLDYGILFSLFYTFFVPLIRSEPLWALFMIFIFSSRSPFFVLLFQYFYLLYPCFFFKGPIHLIEVYTGLNPCPLYHIYYYSCLSIVSLILVLLCLVLFDPCPSLANP